MRHVGGLGHTRFTRATPTRPAWRSFLPVSLARETGSRRVEQSSLLNETRRSLPSGKSAGTSLRAKRKNAPQRVFNFGALSSRTACALVEDSVTFRDPDSLCMASLSSPFAGSPQGLPSGRNEKTRQSAFLILVPGKGLEPPQCCHR